MTEAELEDKIRKDGFAYARSGDMRAWLGFPPAAGDWAEFAASWEDLRPDQYVAEGDRLRRHAVLSAVPGSAPRAEPHQPHYQSPDYNKLYGGLTRWYEPISPKIVAGPTMSGLLAFCRGLFERLRPGAAWKIELHQFRIEAKPGRSGRPTPEGVHRDGVDCVLALLVRRENILSGTTTVHDLAGRELGSFTLEEPLDSAFIDDARILHGVTPVTPLDPSRPAYRDVLVATFLRI